MASIVLICSSALNMSATQLTLNGKSRYRLSCVISLMVESPSL